MFLYLFIELSSDTDIIFNQLKVYNKNVVYIISIVHPEN